MKLFFSIKSIGEDKIILTGNDDHDKNNPRIAHLFLPFKPNINKGNIKIKFQSEKVQISDIPTKIIK